MLPAYKDLMVMLYDYLLRKAINQSIVTSCEGCQWDAPGQRSHMGLFGCLQSWEKSVDLYFSEVVTTIDAKTLQEKFCQVLEELHWSLPPLDVISSFAVSLLQEESPMIESTLKGPNCTPVDYCQTFEKVFQNE